MPNHTILATDLVIFRLREKLEVVLVTPNNVNFRSKMAFPGGLVQSDEDLESAPLRFFKQIIKDIKPAYLEQLNTFGDVKRDPTGRIVSVAYFALVSPDTELDDTQTSFPLTAWREIDSLPSLAYDHSKMATEALERLRAKLSYTNLIAFLMPEKFTLAELQRSYETILGHNFDKRNFRKKIISLDILKELPNQTTRGAHRPAQLYSFTDTKVKILPIF